MSTGGQGCQLHLTYVVGALFGLLLPEGRFCCGADRRQGKNEISELRFRDLHPGGAVVFLRVRTPVGKLARLADDSGKATQATTPPIIVRRAFLTRCQGGGIL